MVGTLAPVPLNSTCVVSKEPIGYGTYVPSQVAAFFFISSEIESMTIS